MTHATKRLAGSFSASDERISLEMGRIYKVGYIGMVLSAIVAIFYGIAVEGVVADHQLLADAVDQHAVHCLVVLAFGMCVTFGLDLRYKACSLSRAVSLLLRSKNTVVTQDNNRAQQHHGKHAHVRHHVASGEIFHNAR